MTTPRLAGKIALVTGAGRGIGRGCALELARAGADIIINDRPGSLDLAGTSGEVRALGRRCFPIEADAFERPGCEAIVERALREGGRIDILVSNPARNIRGPFLECRPEDFEAVLRATVTAGFHLGQLVARSMVERRPAGNACAGKLVFISSIHAPLPYVGNIAYNTAKAGLENLARSMAMELVAHRINVNVIEPGWIDTPGEREVFGDAMLDAAGPSIPWGRLGRPEDIGKAAAFLASDDADYITAATLRVDGGLSWKTCLSET